MAETTEPLRKIDVEVDHNLNNVITLGDLQKVIISPDGEAAVYTDRGTQTKPAVAAEDKSLSFGVNTASVFGVKVELAADDGALVIHADRMPVIWPAAA